MTTPVDITSVAQQIEDAYGITVDEGNLSVSGTDFLGRAMVYYGSLYAGCLDRDGRLVANSKNWRTA